MAKAELTAENRPAWGCGQHCVAVKGNAETHKNQGGVEILVVLLHVFSVVLRRFLFVHGVKINLGVVVLDGLEVHPQSLLDTVWSQFVGPCNRSRIPKTYHRGSTLTGFTFSSPPIVVSYRWGNIGWFERREYELPTYPKHSAVLVRVHVTPYIT